MTDINNLTMYVDYIYLDQFERTMIIQSELLYVAMFDFYEIRKHNSSFMTSLIWDLLEQYTFINWTNEYKIPKEVALSHLNSALKLIRLSYDTNPDYYYNYQSHEYLINDIGEDREPRYVLPPGCDNDNIL